jgi:cellulose synthase/poly-beta-1,6-N-acetylglucosamine synthase-like glycosyltransferase
MRMIILGARLPLVERADSSAAMGVGAFNLVRRSALAESPGLEWLKMEIADDMGLGVMMKKSGARCAAAVSGEAVSLQFYPSLRVMTKALEKNGAQAPAALMVFGNLVLATVELGFYAGFFTSLWWVAVLIWLLAAVTDFTLASWLCAPRWPALMPGLGVLPLAFAVARSSILAALRGGVVWRGTFYSTAAVRAGQRIK